MVDSELSRAQTKFGSTCRPTVELCQYESPWTTQKLERAGYADLSSLVTTVDASEPLSILIFPDRTEVVWGDQNRVVTQKTRTFRGKLSQARREAQKLRDMGARVTVYTLSPNRGRRVLVEARLPLANGKLGEKHTRYFQSENDAIGYIKGLTKAVAEGRGWDVVSECSEKVVG